MAANFKKQFSENFNSIQLPQPIDHMTPEAVAALPDDGKMVVDVREAHETKLGSIVGSKNYPLDDFQDEKLNEFIKVVKTAFEKNAEVQVIFVSSQSPDIDEAAALAFAKAWDEQDEVQAKRLPEANTFIHILLGGFFHWLQLFHADTSKVADYDEKSWGPLLQAAEGKTEKKEE